MKHIYIDGSSMLMTAYYGNSPERGKDETDEEYFKKLLQTKNGIYTNAVVIMMRTLLHIINAQHPDYMAIAFDSGRADTFRAKMYSAYKGTRKPVPEPITQQINTMVKICRRIGIPVFFKKEYEADDIICSLVDKNKSKDNEIIVISKDHDYYQLIDDDNNVILWQMQNSKEKAEKLLKELNITQQNLLPKYVPLNEAAILKLEGIKACQTPDYKGMAGDKSDNIPGIPKIGEETAKKLLRIYESLENIYMQLYADETAFISKCKASGIRNPVNALKAGAESGFMSLSLAMMSKSAADDIPLEKIAFSYNENTKNNLRQVCTDYELHSVLNYI